ncbi:major facilitator superfamily domain-containing protein [Diplogelasinospora grovesii]|uniref:Major facilitator superfamily domain-containing protein n=1 Tax=Diplogelasinospora grovesii TaxID=303347 RepID=A0AAN6N6C3_9PEZI|nr:major facilitator superfamily domain-containing protein [Diplogelasinospora grovesii]
MQSGDIQPVTAAAATEPQPTPQPNPPAAGPTQERLDSGSEINYLYLTFATPIPNPNTTTPISKENGVPAPPQPDLRPYINPILWGPRRKNVVLALSCFATFVAAYSAGSYSPPAALIQAELGAPSNTAVLAGISTFCLGFGIAPMVLAPFSEINGRYPVFIASGVIFVIFQFVSGVVTNLAGMLIVRFLVGIGGSVFSTMVGGVIADVYEKQTRNTPMTLFSGAVLAGTGGGPFIGSIMAYRLDYGSGIHAGWKWVFWHQVITAGVLMLLLVFVFKETRGSVLLSRKAKVLNKWYEQLEAAGYYGVWVGNTSEHLSLVAETIDAAVMDEEKFGIQQSPPSPPVRLERIRWKVKEDEERSSIGKMITISIYRPFHLLFTEPVVFFFSLWVAFAWGVLYLTFSSIPLVFERVHGWNLEQAGRIFTTIIIGSGLATAIGIWQEHILHHPKWQRQASSSTPMTSSDSSDDDALEKSSAFEDRFWAFLRRRFPAEAPEARLYCTCITATLLPIGLFIFGFTSRPEITWVAPAIGIGLATIGIFSIYLATFNYLADTYHKYASSALAAQSFCRNILGGAFPLVTGPLFMNLGEARAGALMGAIAAILTIVPWVLVFYGQKIRARSPFASQLEHT